MTKSEVIGIEGGCLFYCTCVFLISYDFVKRMLQIGVER